MRTATLRPKAIIAGSVKQTLSELNLKHVWFHRAIFRGEDDEGPVFIFSVNNPKLLNDVELRGFSVHHSAQHHPPLEECEIMARQRVRGKELQRLRTAQNGREACVIGLTLL